RISDSAGRSSVPMKIRSRHPSLRNSFVARPSCPTEIQRWRNRPERSGSQARRSANSTGAIPRRLSESATANGMAPPPAMTPTGDEMSEAAEFMAAAIPSSMLVAVVGGAGERAMFALRDEGEDFGDRRILAGQRLHRI